MDLSSIATEATEQHMCQKGQSWDTELESTDNNKTPLAPPDLQQLHSIICIITSQQQEKIWLHVQPALMESVPVHGKALQPDYL